MAELIVLRERALAAKLGVSRDTLRKIRREAGDFPRARRIVGEVNGWLSCEVDRWLEARPLADRV